MKIAICLLGVVGGSGGIDGRGDMIDPAVSYYSFNKKILEYNQNDIFDTFIHTWSVDYKNRLIEVYNPKAILTEEQDPFDKGELIGYGEKKKGVKYDENYRFRNFSKWNSQYKVLKLKHEYEVKNFFKYDCVFISRLDIWYSTPLVFKDYDLSKLYVFDYHPDLGGRQGHSVDVVFFSNSNMIDGFLINYPNIKKYSHGSAGRNSTAGIHPFDGHKVPFNYITDFAGDNVQHIFNEYHDWALIRKMLGGTRECTKKIQDEYEEYILQQAQRNTPHHKQKIIIGAGKINYEN